MIKNTRLRIVRWKMFIHAFERRLNDYNSAAARNYDASANEMNALLSGSKGVRIKRGVTSSCKKQTDLACVICSSSSLQFE